ncbi:YjiH family protein [Pseudogracilibacillus auburnensis]|uniref:Nucleoside recognition membrane protein YjiH n=1 Tax=Pseudogracilibacillus auburnensis TaxID=1494959 RepID=A0A2V3VIS1_9BACI|nr:YjiH family protein [Pseudogracilibacillus auburnensis]PXW81703.1 nucleoside recognition membrane protein YjiH [Pseudogracilibacillus auburnensis]
METQREEVTSYKISKKGVLKFLIPSLFGVAIFLFPIKDGTSFNIPLGLITEYLIDLLSNYLPLIITYTMIISTLFSLVTYFFKPGILMKSKFLDSLFNVTLSWLMIRVIGTIFAVMTFYDFGLKMIISESTGGTILGLLTTLIIWFLVASFLMPYLINFGIMEFTGTLLRGFIKPLFTLPGRSAIDLLASWIGNVNVGVVLTREQYLSGFYSGREAVAIATNFSTVSLPFCLVIARVLEVDHLFPVFYLTVVIAGIICAIIIPRIPPVSKIPDTFYVENNYTENVPKNMSKFKWAMTQAVKRAESAGSFKEQVKQGYEVFAGIAFTLIPQVMAIGTIALIIAEYTSFFSIISQPMVYVLQLFQLPEAEMAAPATIAGFIDMFMPAILASDIEAEITRFFIGALSLVQIIYLTEMGTLLIVSKMPVNLWNLFVIFIERTFISIPIIALIAHIIF